MEVSFTGVPTDDTNPKLSAVAVEANDNEAITAGPKAAKINKFSDDMEIDIEEEGKK